MNDAIALLVPALGLALVHFVWQGAAIGAVAALALHLLRDASPQARYAVACAALAMCVLAPAIGVAMALFGDSPAPVAAPAAADASAGIAFVALPGTGLASGLEPWLPVIVAAWAAGACALSLRMAAGLAWIRSLRATPRCAEGDAWQRRLDRLAGAFALPRQVALRIVDRLDTPAVVGWLRPVVLLPAAVAARMPVELVEALLAHELAHVRRHDYLANLLQGLAEALLFYHPVTWWLSRRIRDEREQVADRLAAAAIGEPRRLARALSALATLQADTAGRTASPVPHLAQAAQGGQLMPRIQSLVQPARRVAGGRLAFPIAGLAAACLALYAHAQTPESAAPRAATTPAPVAAPAIAQSTMPAPQVAEGPVLATPRAAAAPRAQARTVLHSGDAGDDDSWALVRHGEDSMTLHGEMRDVDDIRGLREAIGRDFLWFRHDGDPHVIVDPATIAQARAAWREFEALSPRMEALGREMESHGERMEELGARMAALHDAAAAAGAERHGQRMSELAAEQQRLAASQMEAAARMMSASEAEREALERRMDALSSEMDAIGERMDREGEAMEAAFQARMAPMEALGREMELAGEPMEALGEQMEAIGEQQEKHARVAEARMRALIDDAVRRGLAEPAPSTSR